MVGEKIINYRIISSIGEGGMGSVFLGRHETLDRNVAIKVLLPELARNPEIRERFINEAKTLSKLNHQNIVTLYDFTELSNNLYLIMEYVEGTGLDIVINKITGPIHLERCIKIFSRILSGFEYAHSMGIVHRDIKPSNIILKSDDTPKILDFGIAKIIHGDSKLTKTGTKIGSVLYMSPEQVLGREIDKRSDIYSLGVTLYEMLCGRVPYDSTTDSEYEIQTKIVNELLPPVRNIIPHISPEVDSIISRATAKDPNYRFQSCEEFQNALQPFISNKYSPVTTPVPSNINRTRLVDTARPVYNTAQNMYSPQITGENKKSGMWLLIVGAVVLLGAIIVITYFLLKDNGETTISGTVNTTNNSEEKKETQKSPDIYSEEQVKTEVKIAINNWLNCWQGKDISCLGSCMTDDYQYETATGKNKYQDKSERLSVWRTQFAERKYISITHSDIQVQVANGEKASASYEQTYVSDQYTDAGHKVLYLRKENGKWKIYKDSFY